MFHVWPRLRIKPSLNQLMKKLAELPFGGIKHPLAFLLTNSSWVQVFTIALGALAGWKLQAIRQAKFQNCALEYPKLLRGLVVLLNARTDCASQHNNHCFRLRQPVSLAIVKRVPQQDWHVSRLLYSGANRPKSAPHPKQLLFEESFTLLPNRKITRSCILAGSEPAVFLSRQKFLDAQQIALARTLDNPQQLSH